MPKSSIFCLIDVSGSMKGAYAKDFSNSKIESLTETLEISFIQKICLVQKRISIYFP